MYKKLLTSLILAVFVLFFATAKIFALDGNVNLYLFWAEGCPHCAREKVFLDTLAQKHPDLQIQEFEITKDQENNQLLQDIGKALDADVSGVPFTIVGNKYFLGYLNDETTGAEIENALVDAFENDYPDVVAILQRGEVEDGKIENEDVVYDEELKPNNLVLPVFGEVNPSDISLPVVTFMIALLDGFNPCAMWTLLFLISLLLGMEGRKRMWILGFSFIAASALVYFLFLSAWLNLFLFLGFVSWVRYGVGLVALAAGGYYLWDFVTNKSGCKASENEQRREVFEKLKRAAQNKNLLLALMGIAALAFAVNLVELVCSAGLPAVYTKILSMADLPTWKYYLYLLFYVFIFMLDDMIVFVVAMATLHTVGIESKYSKTSRLVGGILMLVIGFLLMFKPELLMFG